MALIGGEAGEQENSEFEIRNSEKKERSGQIIAISIPKRSFYPTFAVEAKLPFPMETGG
jgi:hypothetical protein